MDTLEGATSIERMMMAKAEMRGIPLTGSMELLPLCNMNCNMCYVRLSRNEMMEQGRLRTGKEWLELGKQMAEAGTLFLLLTGGEPLLHPDFKEIYLGLRKLGLILTLNTNGTLIDETWARFFGENKPRRINITLYGSSREAYEKLCHYPNGFDQAVRGAQLLREQGVDVKFGGSATPENYTDIEDMLEIGKRLDVPVRIDTYMMPANRERNKEFESHSRLSPEKAADARIRSLRGEMGEELFQTFCQQMIEQIDHWEIKEEVPGQVSCHAGHCSFTVNWQGQIRPCVVLTEPFVDVFETGFEEGWHKVSEAFKAVRYCAKCTACRLSPLCRTCAAAALLESGDYLGVPEYLCRYAECSEKLVRRAYEEMKH